MEKSTLKLTNKIQILIDLPAKVEKKEAMDKLYQYQDLCSKAANLIVSHLYVQEMIKDFFYLSEGITYKLGDEKKHECGILKCSRTNTTYQVASNRFKGEIPSTILSCLSTSIIATFNKNRSKYWKGQRSLENFKKDMAFPFQSTTLSKLSYDPDKKAFCFRLFSIPFKTYLGKGAIEKGKILERLVDGDIKLCTSKIQLKGKKIFLLAVLEIEKEKHSLKPEKIAEASLSLDHPIVVKINNAKLSIGSKEEFLLRRMEMQAAYKRTQEGAAYCKSGKGRKRKLKSLEKSRETESNYVAHHLHLYSRKLIDFCVKNQAGTLMLVNQEDKMGIAKEEEFVLRNWSYYGLITKIMYKAEKAGIELIIA